MSLQAESWTSLITHTHTHRETHTHTHTHTERHTHTHTERHTHTHRCAHLSGAGPGLYAGRRPDTETRQEPGSWVTTRKIKVDTEREREERGRPPRHEVTGAPHLYPGAGPPWWGGALSWLFMMMCSRSFCRTRGLATAPGKDKRDTSSGRRP